MKKGFTLIELLIVVAIIAILAAIAVPNFLEAQVRSKVSRCQADLRSFATGAESYAVDNTCYPPIVAPNSPRALTGAGAIVGPSVFHPGVIAAVSSRFIWITTPKAYITSAFMDPFINPSVKFAYAPSGAIAPEYDTYDYVDAKSLTPDGALKNPSERRAAGGCSGAAWHIVGAGPDKKNCFGGGPLGPGYGPLTEAYGCDYDPTNGTISSGDIVRIGGGPGPLMGRLPAYDRIQHKKNTPFGSP